MVNDFLFGKGMSNFAGNLSPDSNENPYYCKHASQAAKIRLK